MFPQNVDYRQFIGTFVAVILAITVHEFAHAKMADNSGDSTPRMAGRLSLNPLDHFDVFGLMMIIWMCLGGFGIGWGKPVPINPLNFDHPRRDDIKVSLAGIVIYIAWRFQFDFGVAATIATFHDVLAVLGVVFLLNKEITLLIVTALLTIGGYSLTDTLVVYDRIRENLRSRRKEGLGDVINASINQVLSRTAMTSLTVLLAALSMFLIGGDVLHDFSFALLIGVLVGTYSSWFVASPLIYEWRIRAEASRRARR